MLEHQTLETKADHLAAGLPDGFMRTFEAFKKDERRDRALDEHKCLVEESWRKP